MAKFQLCMFQRKKNDKRERGIAMVSEFGVSDVSKIIDENGNEVKGIWDYRLMYSFGPAAIDTDTEAYILR